MPEEKTNPKSEIWDEVFSWAKTIVFAVVVALFINNFVIVNTSVRSGSMEDTIQVKDRLVAFRLSYLRSDPQRFDIVVFRYPDDESILYVKRIIGLPGETVEVKDGLVYINGAAEPLRDDFIKNEPYGNAGPYQVPEGHYFMMGDNRNKSEDSRDWQNTYLNRDNILGKIIFRYFPGFKNLSDK